MSIVVEVVKQGVVAFCDFVNVVQAANEVLSERGEGEVVQFAKVASLVNRSVLIGFSAAQVGCVATGARSEVLRILRQIQLIPKIARIPIEHSVAIAAIVNGRINALNFAERCVGPVSDLCAHYAEIQIDFERRYLEMSPEELKQATRPVYEYDSSSESLKRVGERPVDLDECRENIRVWNTTANIATAVRATADLKIPSRVMRVSVDLYGRLANYLRVVQGQQEVLHVDDLGSIPSILHNDPIFSRFQCPITGAPIFDPVGDPNGIHLYERSAILAWLEVNRTSPMTRARLTVNRLVEKPGIKALITHRLRFHQANLDLYVRDPDLLARNLTSPAAPALVANANREMPEGDGNA